MASTLLDQIITEVRLHNPSATFEEISAGIAKIVGNEILPKVLKSVSLPDFPTYRSVETAEARSTKRKIRKGDERPISLAERRIIIQQVEYVRGKMGWDGGDDVKPEMRVKNSPSFLYAPRTDLLLPTEVTKKEGQVGKTAFEKEVESPKKETVDGTFQKMVKQPEKDIIILSNTAQEKVVSEPIFEMFFKNVEVQLRSLIASRDLRTEVDVTCKSDMEIPSWKKCVLTIHPPSELTFNERMNISTIFDVTIRKAIDEMKRNANETTVDYLKNLNRSIFIHIDL